ncbi:LAFE_0G17634g1_1 [Lachancea fermentati]|uniref:Serine/threonine-protein kinase BUR1 n=1 Tax=Lachancea fermentati TaxID=4955 RepID=A0A1G4MIR2_LACFM|nr:LAFE_0G17634g1_1 [Lachancea fermentati]
MSENGQTVKKSEFKYKIGKVKQTPPVLKDDKTGLEYIELKPRENEKVYGCTTFAGHYSEEKKLGQGTFGEVYRGVHLETQRQVAMKRIIVKAEKDLFPITAQREITILRKLSHKNVIKLIEMVYDYPPTQPNGSTSSVANPSKSFYMILPYMVADLSGILNNPRMNLEMPDIKNILLQILEGINYIHCQKYMHRDIKTANLLVDHKGVLKIADFGLARNYYGAPPNLKYPGGAGVDAKYTSVVVTRWYRAPELVLGDKHYTTAVDMWGVGCVFAEFFEKKPILQGKTDIDQGHVIFKLMGTPSEEAWPLAKYLPGAELTKTEYPGTLKERFGAYLNAEGLDLLSKLLSLDPYKRLTAMAAKEHPFFEQDPLPKLHLQLPCEESHEADIKRYRQEQSKSTGQQPPPPPPGHIIEKQPSSNLQLPGGPKALKKLPTGPRLDSSHSPKPAIHKLPASGPPAKRSTPVDYHPQPGISSRAPRNLSLPKVPRYSGSPPDQGHVSRYSGSQNNASTATPSNSGRTDSRYRGDIGQRSYGAPRYPAASDSQWHKYPRSRYNSAYGSSAHDQYSYKDPRAYGPDSRENNSIVRRMEFNAQNNSTSKLDQKQHSQERSYKESTRLPTAPSNAGARKNADSEYRKSAAENNSEDIANLY